ncbi:MAG: arginyltransferase [Sulfuriferula sp.]
MNPLHDISGAGVQSFLSPWFPCVYLPDRKARMQVATPAALITEQAYSKLAQYGFRRVGYTVSRPNCDACQACVPVRIDVAVFATNRDQRQAWKRHSAMEISLHPLNDKAEYFELYERYQLARHKDTYNKNNSLDQYRNFVLESRVNTKLVEFRETGILRMVSIIDLLEDGISSVYTFYEPDRPQTSFGTYNVLWQIEWCRTLQLPYVYPGYWIEKDSKTSYMGNFRPLQGLFNNTWLPVA